MGALFHCLHPPFDSDHPPPMQPDCLGYARDDGPGHEARYLVLGRHRWSLPHRPSSLPRRASGSRRPRAPLRRSSPPSSDAYPAPATVALRLAPGRSGGAALGAWDESPAGGAGGEAGGCAPGAGAKCSLKFLYVPHAATWCQRSSIALVAAVMTGTRAASRWDCPMGCSKRRWRCPRAPSLVVSPVPKTDVMRLILGRLT